MDKEDEIGSEHSSETTRLLLPGEKVSSSSQFHRVPGAAAQLQRPASGQTQRSLPSPQKPLQRGSSSSSQPQKTAATSSFKASPARASPRAADRHHGLAGGELEESSVRGGTGSSRATTTATISSNSSTSISNNSSQTAAASSGATDALLATSSKGADSTKTLNRSNSFAKRLAASPVGSMTRSGSGKQKQEAPESAEQDLESGTDQQPQCRICLESDGRDFIAPCRCKGSAKFVHRECLDQWRSVKEGFAFAHCTTCKMRYNIRVHAPLDARWRTAKFRCFVTRDALAVTLAVQLFICVFGYSVYFVDHSLNSDRLRASCGFKSILSFYYLCGLVIFFFMAGLLGCIFTCIDRRFRSDIGGPCRELCACCCNPLVWGDCHCCSPLCLYADCSICADCAGASAECLTAGGIGEAGAMIFVTIGAVALVIFAVVGIFYSLVVAAVVAQRIWQRHYHILAKRMLAKEYVVEDLAGHDLPPNYTPPPLPPEHEKQLKELGLLPA